MRARIGLGASVLVLLAGGRVALAQESGSAVGLVRIAVTTEDGPRQGSGFLIDSSGTILTVFDVVRSAQAVSVVLPGGEVRTQVRLLFSDDRRNIAFLKVEGSGDAAAPLGDSDRLLPGDSVTARTSADSAGFSGTVSGRRQMGGFHWLQFTFRAPQYVAGSPVLNAQGAVIGVLVVQGRRGRERCFGVPINYVRDLLPRALREPGRALGEGPAAVEPVTGASEPSAPPPIDPAVRASQLDSSLAVLKHRSAILLRIRGGERLAGPLVRRDPGALVVGPFLGYGDSDTTVMLSHIDSLWVQGNGSRLYGIIGAGSGLLLGAAITSSEGAGKGAVGGLVLGAGAGWLIGSVVPRWEFRFPRRRR